METLIPFSLFSWSINNTSISEYYFHTIPGSLTLAPLIFALRGLSRNREASRKIGLFLLTAFLGTLLLYGWFFGAGLARQTLQPVVVLLLVFAAKAFSETRSPTFILGYLLEGIEFCIFIWWIHIYDLYLLQVVYTPDFCRKMMLAWDLVDPNQLFFIVPAAILQVALFWLAISVARSSLQMSAQIST